MTDEYGEFAGSTILIVSGNDATLHLCSYTALEFGLNPRIAYEPCRAFRILAELNVRMVFTDIEFPAHTGIDLTHFIRTNHPDVPVVVFTPFGDVAAPVSAIKGGATDYLVKPFSAAEFREKLRLWKSQQGPFNQWNQTEQGGLPERRTFRPIEEIASSLAARGGVPPDDHAPAAPRLSVHRAKLADAVRTLRQVIRRDLEEVALFSAIQVQELRDAFIGSEPTMEMRCLQQALRPDEEQPNT